MKNSLLLIVFFFSFYIAQGQQVFPAFSDNPEWNTENCGMSWGAPGGITCGTGVYVYTGQANICGEIYNQVNNYFYVREENGRVYIRKNGNCAGRKYLLYDFTIQPGDTVYTGYALNTGHNPDTARFILDSINIVTMHGVQRRVFSLRTQAWPGHFLDDSLTTVPVKWIEGIGSDLHPFHAMICWADYCETFYSTLCAFSSGQQIYGGIGANACEVMSRGSELEEFAVQLYPNPAKNQFTLSLPVSDFAYDVNILDVTGRTVYSTNIITSANESENIVSVSGIPAGVYVVRVANEKAQTNVKLVFE